MSDRFEATTNQHPLREAFLCFLEPGHRDVLVTAAVLIEHALLEYERGPGETPFNVRLCQGAERDLKYVLDHLAELLESWDGSSGGESVGLRSAAEAALHCVSDAHSNLAVTLEEWEQEQGGGDDDR